MYTQTYTSGPFFLQTYTSRILASYPTAALRRVSRTGIRSENGAEATRGGDSERRSHDGRRAKRHLPAVVDKRACARTRHREHRIQRDSDKPPCPPPCTAPSPAERKRRANRCSGVIWIRKAEALPDDIANDEIHYALVLPPDKKVPALPFLMTKPQTSSMRTDSRSVSNATSKRLANIRTLGKIVASLYFPTRMSSASASAISTDIVRLLRPIYKPLSFAPRAPATTWQNLCALICQAELYRLADFTTLKSPPITPLSRATRPSQPLLAM